MEISWSKLNDFGFAGTVGGEFKGGTDIYMHWDYYWPKRFGGSRPEYPPLDYKLDAYAAYGIVGVMWGPDINFYEVGSGAVDWNYMHLDYLEQKLLGYGRCPESSLDYRLDTWAVRRIVYGTWGCGTVPYQVGSEESSELDMMLEVD